MNECAHGRRISEMKLLLLKNSPDEDPIINRIDSLKQYVLDDPTGIYVDELLVMIIDYCRQFPSDHSVEVTKTEEKISEARFWFNEYLEELEEQEAKETGP